MNQPIRLLHLEDDPRDAELIRLKLKAEDLSCDITWVNDRKAFESALAQESFDLVLSDYDLKLPDFDGMSALKQVREKQPDLPVIVLSGTLGEEAAVECLKAGAHDYVLKQRLLRLAPAITRAVSEAREHVALRQAERELEETRSRLDNIVSSLSDVVWSYSLREKRLLYVSAAVEEVYGRPAAAFYENPDIWRETVHPDDRVRVKSEREAGLAAGRFESVYRAVLPDGGVRWLQDRMRVIRDANGRPVRLDGLARDITDRKNAEQALVESEARFRALTEMSSDFYWESDTEHRLTKRASAERAVNPMAVFQRGTRIGERRWEIPNLSPDEAGWQAHRAVLDAHLPFRDFVFSRLGADGTERYLSLSGNPVFDAHAAFEGYRGVGTDITGRREAETRIRRLNRVYTVLSGINAAIVRIRDREELYREVCRIAVDAGGFKFVWLSVVDREQQRLRPVASAGDDNGFLETVRGRMSLRADSPEGQGLAVRAVMEKKATVVNDVERDPQIRYKKEHADRGIRSVAVLPLFVEGEATGAIGLHSGERGFFDEEEMRLLLGLAGDISFALEHIEKGEKLAYLAWYDPLTGLPNRTLFVERLNQYVHAAAPAGAKLAVALADVERLKTINESLGRQAGDALLKHLAARLVQAADPSMIGRIAADQFAVILQSVKGRSEVARRVESLWHDCLSEPIQVGEAELRISVKAGIALYPNDGGDAEMLLRNAEAALGKTKETGERYVFYASAMTALTAETLTLENRLRQALEKDEFVLHYQPKVDLETRRIVGMEALIRWQSPELGLVPPGKFIPLMEETGLILDVGSWALRRAAADHRNWTEQKLKPHRVAVNVSAIQLRQRDFVGAVEQAIIEGVAPTGIDLEITESLVMEDVQGNIEKLKAVRGLGIAIAIDDFGTGYSSLGYLAKLPVQALKIDRSFIITMLDDPDTMTLVQTIISLAHSLRLKVIAEGVDSEDQAKFLRLLRCDEMQGYLFSRPVPFDAMTALLLQSKKDPEKA